MNARTRCLAAFGAALLSCAGACGATTCYIVTDRNENVIYRSTYPPVDLSDEGAPARERMRQRGEYLMFAELDTCPGVTFFTGTSGSRGLALDEVVNGMPALPVSGGVSSVRGTDPNAAVGSSRGSAAGAPAAAARPAPAKRY